MFNDKQGIARHIQLGILGEDVGCKYLLDTGHKIVKRNHRETYGEIDIIAIDKHGVLLFVEVKTVQSRQVEDLQRNQQCGNEKLGESGNAANMIADAIMPEDQMTHAKMIKFKRVAQLFAGKHQNMFNADLGWRLDLLAITAGIREFRAGGSGFVMELGGERYLVTHYKNIC